MRFSRKHLALPYALFLLLLVVPFVISDGKKQARESYQ